MFSHDLEDNIRFRLLSYNNGKLQTLWKRKIFKIKHGGINEIKDTKYLG